MRGRRLTQSKKLSKLAVATDAHVATNSVRPSGYRKYIVIAVLCVFVVASSVLLLQRSDRQAKVAEETTTDVTVLVGKAKDKLSSNSNEEIESFVNEITATKGHDSNQDALYIVVTYYIKASNATKAREYLDKLMLIYDGSKGFSKELGPTKTILQLEADVVFLEKQTSQFKDGLSAGVGAE
jgi:hypothetical protein